MAVILQERGRGKYRPAPDSQIEEIKSLLREKMEEERKRFAQCSAEIDVSRLRYDKNKYNVLSLFCGCGGLDLGLSCRAESCDGRRGDGGCVQRQKGF